MPLPKRFFHIVKVVLQFLWHFTTREQQYYIYDYSIIKISVEFYNKNDDSDKRFKRSKEQERIIAESLSVSNKFVALKRFIKRRRKKAANAQKHRHTHIVIHTHTLQ